MEWSEVGWEMGWAGKVTVALIDKLLIEHACQLALRPATRFRDNQPRPLFPSYHVPNKTTILRTLPTVFPLIGVTLSFFSILSSGILV